MKTNRLLIVALLLLIPTLGLPQAEQKTQTADIKAHLSTFNWKSNVYVFSGAYTGDPSGNTIAILHGDYDATVYAPKMTFTLPPKGQKVGTLTATGPVRFEILTPPDQQGLRTKIVATATDSATYSEVTQKLMLKGNADATITRLPESPDTPNAHITGDEIDANLQTGDMTVTTANMTVSGPLSAVQTKPEAKP
jgi:lipopolysaccharide export system protein LptA